MIEINDINIKKPQLLLENSHLSIYDSCITAIIGKSGCGKTTLLQEISLLGQGQYKNYFFNNVNIKCLCNKEQRDFLKKNICFVMQDVYLFKELSIMETIILYSKLNHIQISEEDIILKLNEVNLDLDVRTPVSFLSGGEKQRLSIMLGFLKDAQLFIFDEPFAYLDKENRLQISTLIKNIAYQKHKMVLITTHLDDFNDEFDCVYEMKHNQLQLVKETVKIKARDYNENILNSWESLKYYASLINKKHFFKTMIVSFVMAFIISTFIITIKYNDYFQTINGKSIMSFLKNEVTIVHKDYKKISPREQNHLKDIFSEYDCYPEYVYSDMHNTIMVGYLDNEMGNMDIYKKISGKSMINKEILDKPIYVSYSLYRNQYKNKQYPFIDNNKTITFIADHVLMPSSDNRNTIYIPYKLLMKIFKKNNMDTSYMNVGSIKVFIQDISHIEKINQRLPQDYMINYNDFLKESIQISQIFNNQFFSIFMILVLISIFVYKCYHILSHTKDIILFKIYGVSNKELILMKIYQQITEILFTGFITIVFSICLLWCLNIFNFYTILSILTIIFVIYIIFFVIIVFIFGFTVLKKPVSILLRK